MSMSDADPSLELYDYRTTGRHIDIVVMTLVATPTSAVSIHM